MESDHETISRVNRLRLLGRAIQIPRQYLHEACLHRGFCRADFGYSRMEGVDEEYQEWLADPDAQLEYQLWSISQDLQQLTESIQ
jgi:hypothetical protein